MSTAFPLIPRAKLDAEQNLAAFIEHARCKLTAFGADLDFEADKWDVTKFYSEKGHRNAKQGTITIHFTQRNSEGGKAFCPQLKDFAKAYVRSRLHSRNSAAFSHTVRAFRALDAAMQEMAVSSLVDCDASVFNRASELLRAKTKIGEDGSAGAILGVLARFLDEKGLVHAPLHDWKYIKIRKSAAGRLGEEFERRRKEKMPPQEALDALPLVFHQAREPRDILISALTAILCSAPERINEVMVLPEKCEIEQTGDEGKTYLGLRWPGSKGYSDHIKWILPGMADVVREALARIRRITESARTMARWYEANPTKLYLPPELEHLRSKEILDLEDVWEIVNLGHDKRAVRRWVSKVAQIPYVYVNRRHPVQGEIPIQAVRFADVERYIVSTLLAGFPIYDAGRNLKYSDALLVIPEGLFGNRGNNEGCPCMFEAVRYHHIGCALGQNKHAGSATIFERVGLDPDGQLVMKSHQFRHYLNTLAQGANLSQVDIAKWSGRANIHQNSSYDHVSSQEIVAQIRAAIGDHAKAIGALAEIPKNLPVSRAEFAEMAVTTAHVTLYGFCIHDFTTTPCEMFRKCLDCREHVCIKGVPGKVERVRQALQEAERNLAKAHAAVADEVYGADDWVIAHQATVDRLQQLLSILTNPNVADGAVIQLSASGTYSLSEGAVRDRAALVGDVASLPNTLPSDSTLQLPALESQS